MPVQRFFTDDKGRVRPIAVRSARRRVSRGHAPAIFANSGRPVILGEGDYSLDKRTSRASVGKPLGLYVKPHRSDVDLRRGGIFMLSERGKIVAVAYASFLQKDTDFAFSGRIPKGTMVTDSVEVLDESRRRRGLGSALLREVEAEAVRQGMTTARAMSVMGDAEEWWRKQGYEYSGRLRIWGKQLKPIKSYVFRGWHSSPTGKLGVTRDDLATEGIGYYVGLDKDEVKGFGRNVIPAEVTLRNPLDASREPPYVLHESDEIMESPKQGDSVWLSSIKEAVKRTGTTDHNWSENLPRLNRAVTDVLVEKGYDGVIMSSWVVKFAPKETG